MGDVHARFQEPPYCGSVVSCVCDAGTEHMDAKPSMSVSGPHTQLERIVISVCVSCRALEDDGSRPGQTLLDNLRDSLAGDSLALGLALRPVQCLSVCKRPCTVALSGTDRYTYVFGDLDPVRDAATLLDCARTYGEQEHGYMLWRERPEPFRRGIVARIPPSGWVTEDGRHPR